jgi:two-component system LytT family response regulator
MSTKPLQLLLADDESLARDLVRGYVDACEGVEIVDECESGDELPAALKQSHVDLMLLDIRMPGNDVFDTLNGLAANMTLPFIIFATAFDSYAVRAFEMNAVDYLVKPFPLDRFSEAISRVRKRMALGQTQREISNVIRDLGPRPDRLLVPDGDRMIPVPITNIIWIEAEGDYSRLHTPGKTYLVSRPLKELEARLDPNHFIRIHRSAIVRSDRIREVHAEGSSRYRVVLTDGANLIVSRTRSQALRRWMI